MQIFNFEIDLQVYFLSDKTDKTDKTVNYIFAHPRLAATSTKSCLSPKHGIYFLEFFLSENSLLESFMM